MGQTSLPEQTEFEWLYKKYSVRRDEYRPALWHLLSLQHQPYLMKELNLTDSAALPALTSSLQRLTSLRHPNYLSAIQYYIQSSANFCSTIFRVGIVFEALDLTLAGEIHSRHAQDKPFMEKELWSILCSLVLAIGYLDQQGVGCLIGPDCIFISSRGEVKLADLEIAEILAIDGFNYPPPQGHKISNQYRGQIFSLGMTLLHCALLQPCTDCYLNPSINEHLLTYKLKKLSLGYSDTLTHFLQRMLQTNPQMRPSLLEMQAMLNAAIEQLDVDVQDTINLSYLPDEQGRMLPDTADPPSVVAGMGWGGGRGHPDEGNSRAGSKEVSPCKYQDDDQSTNEYVSISKLIQLGGRFDLYDPKQQPKKEPLKPRYDPGLTFSSNSCFQGKGAPIQLNFQSLIEKTGIRQTIKKQDKENRKAGELFTDPSLLELMRHEVSRIKRSRHDSQRSQNSSDLQIW